MMIIQKTSNILTFITVTHVEPKEVMEIIYKKSEFTQDDKKLNNGVRSIAACHNV